MKPGLALTAVPIGVVRSPWTARFGIPRQAGLVPVEATIELDAERCPPEAVRGLEAFSHVWVVAWFHDSPEGGPTVRPPRLGGNARVGVLASRSPVRPVPIGLSAVELLAVEPTRLRVRGADLLDGTPVLDIKPYVPWCDAIESARGGWASEPPTRRPVRWSDAARTSMDAHPEGATLRPLVEAALSLDPRPAYHAERDDGRRYAMRFADLDVGFCAGPAGIEVLEVTRVLDSR